VSGIEFSGVGKLGRIVRGEGGLSRAKLSGREVSVRECPGVKSGGMSISHAGLQVFTCNGYDLCHHG